MLILFVILTSLILGGIFGGDAFANQWRLEDSCDSASSIAARAGTTDPFALQDAVNKYTLSLKNLDGFTAVVTLVDGDQSVLVACRRTVKPRLSSLFLFKHGITQRAKSKTTRTFG